MTTLDRRAILLVYPSGSAARTRDARLLRLVATVAPIGLLHLAAYLERRQVRVGIVDCAAERDPGAALRGALRTRRPAWLGLSCTTFAFHDGVRLIEEARRELPGVRAVVGGVHVSALKERILRDFPGIDYLVVGEGEETLAELIERDGASLSDVPGLVYRDADGEPRFTGHRPLVADLDSLPLPAYERLRGFPRDYRLPIFSYPRTATAGLVTSRGCPYQCTYCDRSVFRRSYRCHSADFVYEHLRFLRQRYRVRHVTFYDDQFTMDRRRTVALCERLASRPLGMTFNCAVRSDHTDPELLRLMKRAGCWMISVGIESGDDALLAEHRQHMELDRLAESVRAIRRAGIRAKGLMIMGLPGETEASIRRTMAYAFALPLNEINLTKFAPFPGAPSYPTLRERGTFDEDWSRLDCLHFQFIPQGMTKAQLEGLYREFYRRHFMRWRVLFDYGTMWYRSPDSWVRFLLHLGAFARAAWNTGRDV
jgi:radical SAM superfamily enzyme YgiQ (UPF0313 family)